jgi:hypothetical protein
VWEPDFLLETETGESILLEVKGDHNERIHKPTLAQEAEPTLIVLIGREPYLSAYDIGEYAGAVWHRPDGSGYGWTIGDVTYVSAEQATEETKGLKFYRGLENTRKIR